MKPAIPLAPFADVAARAVDRQQHVVSLPRADVACRCGGRGVRFDRAGDSASAEPCAACNSGCDCDKGWWFATNAAGHRITARCGRCGLAEDRALRWCRADIPSKFWDAWLDAATKPPPKSMTAKAMVWRLTRWIETWQPGGPGLFIFGPKGVGKTHAMVGAMRWLLLNRVNAHNRPFTMRYADLSLLWEALKAAFRSDGGPQGVLQRLIGPTLLVLDEVGQARNTPWQVEQLSELVGRRYNAGRTTVFLSNHHPQDIAGQLDAAIEYGGARLVDRMAEMANLIEVRGQSRRTWTSYEPD